MPCLIFNAAEEFTSVCTNFLVAPFSKIYTHASTHPHTRFSRNPSSSALPSLLTHQINSTSPVPHPTHHCLTALHLTTQTSPLFISNLRSVPSTKISPTSLSARTNTALSSSGL